MTSLAPLRKVPKHFTSMHVRLSNESVLHCSSSSENTPTESIAKRIDRFQSPLYSLRARFPRDSARMCQIQGQRVCTRGHARIRICFQTMAQRGPTSVSNPCAAGRYSICAEVFLSLCTDAPFPVVEGTVEAQSPAPASRRDHDTRITNPLRTSGL